MNVLNTAAAAADTFARVVSHDGNLRFFARERGRCTAERTDLRAKKAVVSLSVCKCLTRL